MIAIRELGKPNSIDILIQGGRRSNDEEKERGEREREK